MRRGWKAPACPSGKRAFRSQGRALAALVKISVGDCQAAVHDDELPRGAYRCRACGAWHLTRSVGAGTVLPPG